MKSEILVKSETLKIEYFYDEKKSHKKLAYIFTPSMNRNLEGNRFGGEIFYRNGYDTIAIKVSNDDWFQSIPSNFFERVKRIITENEYEKKVAYGSSMGGYASIALSKLLDCNVAIVFSPQYSIDEEFDKRWSSYAKKIDFKYRISKNSIKNDCNFCIFYDNKNLDEMQVKKLLEVLPVENTKLIKLPYTGHPAIHYLAEVGLIKDVAIKIANECSVDGINFLENKRLSKSYFRFLSYSLLKKNHVKWALSAIDSAIQIDTKDAGLHRRRSIILDKLARFDEAIISIKEAIKLEPNSSPHLVNLSNLLNKSGMIDEAIEASKKSITLDPKNPNHQLNLSNLLNKSIGKTN